MRVRERGYNVFTMIIRNPEQRVAVLVDVQNLYYSAKNLYHSRVNFKNILNKAFNERVVEKWQDNDKRYNDDTKLFEPVATAITKELAAEITNVCIVIHRRPARVNLNRARSYQELLFLH